ncbi:MAG: HIT domain-containing protein [Candidatus Omnitrophica bacterium]|nr:HIT domain-containing protein [Candidatus Omnitrophota bacterium]
MNIDRLWAPWRIKYIGAKKRKGCLFCQAGKSNKDFLVFKTKYSLCIMNIFPYNNGHLMVAPLKHTNDLSKLNEKEALDLFYSLNKAQQLLKQTLKPHGFNIGINLSAAAGAGITQHLHIHIVPRWCGDSNFMPIVANTKVISQSLEELHRILKKANQRIK